MSEIAKRIYYPMLVSNSGTADFLTPEEDGLLWKKYITLPQIKQDILTDAQLPLKLAELQSQLGLSDETMGYVSLVVRKMFFGELSPSDAVGQLNQKLTSQGQSAEKAQEIIQFIQNQLFSIKPKPKIEEVEETLASTASLVHLPLLKAITKYENLGQQLITTEKIKVKSQPEPVRPSLAHWIRYYRDELGVGFHDQVLRGKFLFQSENGKRLGNEERERINLVLKSLEEDFPLDIDVEHQTIVFPMRPVAPARTPSPQGAPLSVFPSRTAVIPARPIKPFQPAAPAGLPVTQSPTPAPATKPSFFANKFSPAKNVAGDTLHFSTGHVLPGEKGQGAQEKSVSAPVANPPSSVTPPVPSNTPPVPKPNYQTSGITQNRGAVLPRSPYSIRPLRLRNDVGENEQ